MIKREPDYATAYVYARGYYDGRAHGWCDTPIEWMTDAEKHIYSQGYDKGMEDYSKLNERGAA